MVASLTKKKLFLETIVSYIEIIKKITSTFQLYFVVAFNQNNLEFKQLENYLNNFPLSFTFSRPIKTFLFVMRWNASSQHP